MSTDYISSIEADKLKLKLKVKRLRLEINSRRKSLTEILQDLEISQAKTTTKKEHLKFVHSQCNEKRNRMDLNSSIDIDAQGEETTKSDNKEGKKVTI